jgi:hypothetical protein
VKRRCIALIALLSSCASPIRACWAPNDRTSGWKQVSLPPGAPALSAPPNVDQYRTNERALAWQERGAAAAQWSSLGSAVFALDLDGRHVDVVEANFEARLGGALVEARALTATGSYVILPRTRSHATTVRLELADPSTESIVLTVHHHVRTQPRLVSWRIGQWQRPAGPPSLLVYRQPESQALLLCNAPEQPLGFHPAWKSESPRAVSLERTLLSRAPRWVWR